MSADPAGPPPGSPKAALRARMRAALAALTPEQELAWSEAICSRLSLVLAAPGDGRVGAVMVFAPSERLHEVRLAGLMSHVLASGRPLAVPAIDWPARTIRPVRIVDPARDLVPDPSGRAFGILAPRPGLAALDAADLGVVVVPGLAFDRTGGRLGRGAGFYDRFLGTLGPGAVAVGVCYEAQVVERVPREPHDRGVDALATESGLWWPAGGGPTAP